jgi:hypothetical protein
MSAAIYVKVFEHGASLGGFMRINRFVSFWVITLSLALAGPAFGQAPSKSAVKSITVYKTPT